MLQTSQDKKTRGKGFGTNCIPVHPQVTYQVKPHTVVTMETGDNDQGGSQLNVKATKRSLECVRMYTQHMYMYIIVDSLSVTK